jgi:hypothetical protein
MPRWLLSRLARAPNHLLEGFVSFADIVAEASHSQRLLQSMHPLVNIQIELTQYQLADRRDYACSGEFDRTQVVNEFGV